MTKKEIPISTIERNRALIEAVTNSLGKRKVNSTRQK